MHPKPLLKLTSVVAALMMAAAALVASIAVSPDAQANRTAGHHQKGGQLPGRIYYASDCDVWSSAPDGTHQRRLTRTSRCENVPYASPDGTMLAFTANSPRGQTPKAIYILQLRTRHIRELALTGGTSWLSWSPNSTWVAYQYAKKHTVVVRLIHPDRTGMHQLKTPFRTAYSPLWSADGRRMYFSTDSARFRNRLHGCSYAPSAVFSIGLKGKGTKLERGSKLSDNYALDVGAKLLAASIRLGHDTPDHGCYPAAKSYSVFSGNKLILKNAWFPKYSPDKKHILFFDTDKSAMAIALADGSHRHLVANMPSGAFGTWGPTPASP